MAAGGSYNAPSAEDTRAGFGNDTQMDSMVGGGGGGGGPVGVTSTPLFGDYKKYVQSLHIPHTHTHLTN